MAAGAGAGGGEGERGTGPTARRTTIYEGGRTRRGARVDWAGQGTSQGSLLARDGCFRAVPCSHTLSPPFFVRCPDAMAISRPWLRPSCGPCALRRSPLVLKPLSSCAGRWGRSGGGAWDAVDTDSVQRSVIGGYAIALSAPDPAALYLSLPIQQHLPNAEGVVELTPLLVLSPPVPRQLRTRTTAAHASFVDSGRSTDASCPRRCCLTPARRLCTYGGWPMCFTIFALASLTVT